MVESRCVTRQLYCEANPADVQLELTPMTSIVPGQRLAFFDLQKSFPVSGWQEGPYTTVYQCHL